MITLLGGSAALAAFKVEAMIDSLEAGGISAADLEATYVYLVESETELSPTELATLESLLGAYGPQELDGLFVAPRKGTISPWSTRAALAVAECHLNSVKRVERLIRLVVRSHDRELGLSDLKPVLNTLHDRMIEGVYDDINDLFKQNEPARGQVFDVLSEGRKALETANDSMSLALSEDEIDYLLASCTSQGHNPTDTELLMFGQVNSEHCRHKIFNASWIVDGEAQELSLFKMIKTTHATHPEGTLVAYADNAGVAAGFDTDSLYVNPATGCYGFVPDHIDILMKAETHNHPTAISPFPGAATGTGGEIRDEAATGTGGASRAGLGGYIVSNLRIPGYIMPWERDIAEFPRRLATPLQIMLEGPAGSASFSNDFGRPQLCGFFRTYEDIADGRHRGYHKPIMMGGGMGAIRRCQIAKKPLPPGALVVQLGGPSMRIGLGGGAASSVDTSGSHEELDFDSVQRGNAEVQRRCQEVIDACLALGTDNPILSIHDVGAGGLSNACPELVEATGATFQLRSVPSADPSLSPMEIWCCEAQERYVLAIMPQDRQRFEAICQRECCPVAFIGITRSDRRLIVEDSHFGDKPVDMPLQVLLGNPPRMLRDVSRQALVLTPLHLDQVDAMEAFERILRLPAVADKSFLVTGSDRTANGLVARDQMVGPYQIPVADCAVVASGFKTFTGSCMAVGERSPVALIDAPASGRLAVAEAVTNSMGAAIGPIGRIKLSANWMAACGEPGEDAALFDTVRAVALSFCPALGIAIPVGKDSLSMRTTWQDSSGKSHRQTAPLSLVVSAFAAVEDVRKTVTPDLKPGTSRLLLVDLSAGKNRLGGSALAQVYNQVGAAAPDCDDPLLLRALFEAMQELVAANLLLACHDRSDGGVAITIAEMAISGGSGVAIDLPQGEVLATLFAEEPGIVIQVAETALKQAVTILRKYGLGNLVHDIGTPLPNHSITMAVGGKTAVKTDISTVRQAWSALSHRLQLLRDNPRCADEEYATTSDETDPGMNFTLTFDPETTTESLEVTEPPRVALLREQGLSGYTEMAAALSLAGFAVTDLHMTDLRHGSTKLQQASGLVVCGNGAYGNVCGAGVAWAHSIRHNTSLMEQLSTFFQRPETFTLGVANGCQLLAQLKDIVPGAVDWPTFTQNISDRFEARYLTVEVMKSPSILLQGMAGSRLPVAVAHQEGRAINVDPTCAALRYVDNYGAAALRYPLNPDGSDEGLCAFTTTDGRATIMMARPERGFRAVQLSYKPENTFTGEAGPWMRLFHNAYTFATTQA